MDEQNVKKILSALSNQNTEAPPYIKSRVLSTLKSNQHARQMKFWKWFGILSPTVSAIAIGVFFVFSSPVFEAETNQPVMVKVELKKMSELQVEFAEIELPEGVYFYSSKFPEIRSQRKVRVAANVILSDELPLVIKSEVKGKQTIKVQFLNQSGSKVGEKSILIKFNG